ncbi:Aspartate kinase Ask_Ect [Vibrio stylophorae]|uniref:aspartate kinase n=2 Tax=Vibrio stylophorae TaxID=659351 RepID=A0ABN8DRL7_9VIBR|nr:Aspartate kinase Ask_Ect [Vibrio stylophorae]
MHTVEKIGGTSMSSFNEVLDNIIFYPQSLYQRIFVVSAYSGITNGLLECKKTGKPGIYQAVADHDPQWQQQLAQLKDRMLLINHDMFSDPMARRQADHFIIERLEKAQSCIQNILDTCQFRQFSLAGYLPQIREFLSSIGEAHSAFNTALLLSLHKVNARFVDLSGWDSERSGNLDEVLTQAMADIDLSQELPIVTGYVSCDEGLMQTYDRGYSEMTFSRLAVLTGAKEAVIHKEYHLSSADPGIVGADAVSPIGHTNYDVADQLANLGMEAIHPNAAAGLRKAGINLVIKNTFEPEHAGTRITQSYQPTQDKVDIIAGKNHICALHIFDQTMVGKIDNISYQIIEIIRQERVQVVGKEMNANSMTYYLSGHEKAQKKVLKKVEALFPLGHISAEMVALISVIGAQIDQNSILYNAIIALNQQGILPQAMHTPLRNVDVQFVVADKDYDATIRTLHQALMEQTPVCLQSVKVA